MPRNLDKKTLKIIFYLVERLDGVLGKTHLQKMLFLADLLAVKKFKEKLTAIEYKKYSYGPYSEVVNDYTTFLKEKGVIEEREIPFFGGSPNSFFRYYKKASGTIKNQLIEELGAEKVLLLDEVISSYGNMSLQQVLDVVYQLEVVKDTDTNTPLDIAKGIESEDQEPREDEVQI